MNYCLIFTINFWLDLFIWGRGGKKTCSNSPNTTLKYCQACIPEMSVVLHGARRGSLEEQKSQDCNWSNFCLLELIGDMRKGVNFNVLSPGSHTGYLLRVGWLMCVSASWAASSLFQFHLSRQGFGLPHSGRQCEISYLDLIVLCRAYFRENTCSLRAGIQGGAANAQHVWGFGPLSLTGVARSGFCSVSVDFNTLEWCISRLGSFQVTHGSTAIDQPQYFAAFRGTQVENICSNLPGNSLKDTRLLHNVLPLSSSSLRGQLW